MTVERIDWLQALHLLCQRQGWAMLLTARPHPAAFATAAWSQLRNLDVVNPDLGPLPATRTQRLISGELVARVTLENVDFDLQAAGEFLVELLGRQIQQERKAA